jgi:hypothetical protein
MTREMEHIFLASRDHLAIEHDLRALPSSLVAHQGNSRCSDNRDVFGAMCLSRIGVGRVK